MHPARFNPAISSAQFMQHLGNRNSGSVAKGKPVVNIGRLIGMRKSGRPVDRTPFGERLFAARTSKGLSQEDAAKAVGMAQSSYAEAERTAHGSTFTVQLAALFEVDAMWLAVGAGTMSRRTSNQPAWPFSRMAPEDWAELDAYERAVVEQTAIEKIDALRAAAAQRELIAAEKEPARRFK